MSRPVTPAITVDIVIEMHDRPARPIVLIERRFPPHGWALPGGFVDVGERLEQAALREAREETSLEVKLLGLLGCYSDPLRDSRGPTIGVVYVGSAVGEPKAQDDARNLALFAPDQCPELAFDHGLIIQDYLRYRARGQVAPLRF